MTPKEEYIVLLRAVDWYFYRRDSWTEYWKDKQMCDRIWQLMKEVDSDRSIYMSYVPGVK